MDSLLLCWDSGLSTLWESMAVPQATLRQRGRSWTEVWSGLCYLIKYPRKRLCSWWEGILCQWGWIGFQKELQVFCEVWGMWRETYMQDICEYGLIKHHCAILGSRKWKRVWGTMWFWGSYFFFNSGFPCVALEPVLEIVLVDQAGLKRTEIHLSGYWY